MIDGPADRLREEAAAILDEAGRRAGVLFALADELGGRAPPRLPDRLVDTKTAEKISGRSSSWLYKSARKFGFGSRLETGSWIFSELRLRAFLAGESVALCGKSDGPCEVSEGGHFRPPDGARIFDPTE